MTGLLYAFGIAVYHLAQSPLVAFLATVAIAVGVTVFVHAINMRRSERHG